MGVINTALPKVGQVLGIQAFAPASTPPDFIGIKANEIFPGWSDMFDGLIQMAEGIKGFAEGTLEFIEALIESIEQLIEDFVTLANAIKELITLLTTGLPDAGIFYLGMETSSGNEGFKSAISGASDAPGANYAFSAGFVLVGDPILADLTGQDPIKTLFSPLGVEFQSV